MWKVEQISQLHSEITDILGTAHPPPLHHRHHHPIQPCVACEGLKLV